MADPTLTGRLLILIGNGATPTEVFSWPCGANARTVRYINNLGSEVLLDCTNPITGGGWVSRWLESQETQLTISGRIATESIAMWRLWADNGDAKNCRIQIDETSAKGGGYHTQKFYLADLEWGREGSGTNGSATFTANLMSTGSRVWTAAV